ncbi:MAG: TIGR03643 family protein [Bacteroidales bacterium]|nr:TIGR03643 family protein [Bacteroidales bacterium]
MPVRKIAALKSALTLQEIDRIIQMAWEDRTPFDAIKMQFGISEAEVIALMKAEMRLQNWKKWRARVQGRATKHAARREEGVQRFKSKMQRTVTLNRISKR